MKERLELVRALLGVVSSLLAILPQAMGVMSTLPNGSLIFLILGCALVETAVWRVAWSADAERGGAAAAALQGDDRLGRRTAFRVISVTAPLLVVLAWVVFIRLSDTDKSRRDMYLRSASIAEAEGYIQQSILHYSEALLIDPRNTSARRALEHLQDHASP